MPPKTPRLQTFDLVDEFLVFLLNFSIDASNLTGLMQSQGTSEQNETKPCCCCCNQFCTVYLTVFRSRRWYQITAINDTSKTFNLQFVSSWIMSTPLSPRQNKTVNRRFLQDRQLRVWGCDGRLRCLATSSHIVTVMVNLFCAPPSQWLNWLLAGQGYL